MNRRLIAAAAAGLIVLACASCGHTSRTATSHPTTPEPASASTTTMGSSARSETTTAPAVSPATPPSGVSDTLPPNFGSLSDTPTTTGPGHSTAQVTVIALNSTDEAALVLARSDPPSCVAMIVPSTVHIATEKSTGVSWALAGLTRVSGCAHDGFYDRIPPPAVGVFERQPGGKWKFNSEDGKPFPCPEGDNDADGGQNSNYIPPDVLQAWQMPNFSSNCFSVVPPEQGQGH